MLSQLRRYIFGMYEIILYETGSGRSPVQDYIKELEDKHKDVEVARIKLYQSRLSQYGMAVNNTHPKTIRPLRDDIYELRPGNNRVFFFYFKGNKFVLLHAYRKHGQKTPSHEIDKAIGEMKDHKRRNKDE